MDQDNSISAFNFFIGYESQNVFVYFMIIPLMWAGIIDYKWIRKPVATVSFTVLVCIVILASGGWNDFTMNFYHAGISFCAFWKKYGYSYAESCIVWCILWPLVISIALTLFPSRVRAVKS
jgi:hypothetical protein